MKDHFAKEEETLTKVLPQNHLMIQKMFEDHEAINNLVTAINGEATEALLMDLANSVKDHVRFEERQLFNYIDEVATTEQLKTLGTELTEHEKDIQPWNDEFWVAAGK